MSLVLLLVLHFISIPFQTEALNKIFSCLFLKKLEQQVLVFLPFIVLQTFSKAWGLAGIRCGLAFSSPEIIELLNKVKPPYNLNILTQNLVGKILTEENNLSKDLYSILNQRDLLNKEEQLYLRYGNPILTALQCSIAYFCLRRAKWHTKAQEKAFKNFSISIT